MRAFEKVLYRWLKLACIRRMLLGAVKLDRKNKTNMCYSPVYESPESIYAIAKVASHGIPSPNMHQCTHEVIRNDISLAVLSQLACIMHVA